MIPAFIVAMVINAFALYHFGSEMKKLREDLYYGYVGTDTEPLADCLPPIEEIPAPRPPQESTIQP